MNNALETMLAGNIAIGELQPTWFVSYAMGDFHLSDMHPVEIDTAAAWQLGDPMVDIDGEPRPMDDGAPDFAGADRIP